MLPRIWCTDSYLSDYINYPRSAMVNSARMLALDDTRWNNLTGGYRTPFDPRPLLARLGTEQDTATVWNELWEELHHQGDIGETSYAVIPHLVRIHRMRGVVDDWNTYAIVAIIELARTETKNPKIPEWLEQDYFRAIEELAEVGMADILRTKNRMPCEPYSASLRLPKAFGTTGGSS
jgi:hypothetical protein